MCVCVGGGGCWRSCVSLSPSRCVSRRARPENCGHESLPGPQCRAANNGPQQAKVARSTMASRRAQRRPILMGRPHNKPGHSSDRPLALGKLARGLACARIPKRPRQRQSAARAQLLTVRRAPPTLARARPSPSPRSDGRFGRILCAVQRRSPAHKIRRKILPKRNSSGLGRPRAGRCLPVRHALSGRAVGTRGQERPAAKVNNDNCPQ